MPYVGNIPAEKYAAFNVQHFTTSATTSYTLTHAVANELDIRLVLNNVVQQPGASYAYTASATTLTLSVATTGTDTMYAVYIGKAVQTVTPGANSVGPTALQDNSVTNAKLADATQGDIIYYGAAGAPTQLGAGTSGYVLQTQGAGANPVWAVDAAGTVTGYTNGVDDRVITSSGATTLNGEAKLTFDGSTLINAQDAGAASEIKSSAGTVYTKVIADDASGFSAIDYSHDLRFKDAGTETMRINSSQIILMGKTDTTFATAGSEFYSYGTRRTTTASTDVDIVNRTGTDGYVYSIHNDSSFEGGISFSGGTITYGTFCGSHWSRLIDNSKPDILKGTVIESINSMCEWYEVEYEINNIKEKEYLGLLPNGKNIGDDYTVTIDSVDYIGKIKKQQNEKLPMSKISDTEDSKAVYGVFLSWDNEDEKVNDMYIASLGAFVVRIHKDETVDIGDYLQSKGDGTGKKQADDILRASTIAKVTSTEKTIIYADGSYCVPCTLHCG